jgi:hypothetical protein
MQEIFKVDPKHGFTWLGVAATANDLSDLLGPGVTNWIISKRSGLHSPVHAACFSDD